MQLAAHVSKAMILPTFIIAGERRCGTTSLYHLMRSHPEVYMPAKADFSYFLEPEFDSIEWWDGELDQTGWRAANTLEGYSRSFTEAVEFSAVGHKTADLLFWQPAHERIAEFLPSVRLIITLRNPVERAWSHYCNEVAKGRETLSFDEALRHEDSRSARSAYGRFHLSYRARGFYADSLRALFAVVPKDRVFVTTVEALRGNQGQTLQELCEFLGIRTAASCKLTRQERNETSTYHERALMQLPGVPRAAKLFNRVAEAAIVRLTADRARRRYLRGLANAPFWRTTRPEMIPEKPRRQLSAEYAASIGALGELLGREFAEWKSR